MWLFYHILTFFVNFFRIVRCNYDKFDILVTYRWWNSFKYIGLLSQQYTFRKIYPTSRSNIFIIPGIISHKMFPTLLD